MLVILKRDQLANIRRLVDVNNYSKFTIKETEDRVLFFDILGYRGTIKTSMEKTMVHKASIKRYKSSNTTAYKTNYVQTLITGVKQTNSSNQETDRPTMCETHLRNHYKGSKAPWNNRRPQTNATTRFHSIRTKRHNNERRKMGHHLQNKLHQLRDLLH